MSTVEHIFEPGFLYNSHDMTPLFDFDSDFVTAWTKTFNFLQWRQDAKVKIMKRRIKSEALLAFHHPSRDTSGYYDHAVSRFNKVKDWGWGLSGWF